MKLICQYCQYIFKSEYDRNTHECEGVVREKQFNSADGISAFNLYKTWMLKDKKRVTPSKISFIKSRYYTIFTNLNKFLKNKNVFDSTNYIDFCMSKKLLPNTWYMDDVYYEYLIFLDNEMSAEYNFECSLECISNIASLISCNKDEVFKYLTFDEVIKLIHSRNVSPWYLLLSKGFNNFYKKLDPKEKIICDSLIKREKWLEKMSSRKDFIKNIVTKYGGKI